ncbi:transmembrane anti-sigma factor [Alicyclobacillus tengchongensis]|nr:transmembrane anti-sigma factor [Alicyclobacillus tengchongensis]
MAVSGRCTHFEKGGNRLDNPSICSLCVDYALGELSDELLKKRFERHLGHCHTCQRDVLEYRELIDMFEPRSEAELHAQQQRKLAEVIPFPSPSRADIRTRAVRYARRRHLTALTLSAALLLMSFLSITGDHGKYSRAIGFAITWHRISHVSRTLMAKGEQLTDKIHIKHGLL